MLATEHLLHSEKFRAAVDKYAEGVEVIPVVGRGFVEAVEAGQEQSDATRQLVADAVEPAVQQGADVIVLGCTHYPFLRGVIREVVGDKDVIVIDSGEPVGKRVESLLGHYDMRAEVDHEPRYDFLTFADEEYCERLRKKAFGE